MNTTAATTIASSIGTFAVCQNSWAAFISVGAAFLISEALPLIPEKYLPANGILHGIIVGLQTMLGGNTTSGTTAATIAKAPLVANKV